VIVTCQPEDLSCDGCLRVAFENRWLDGYYTSRGEETSRYFVMAVTGCEKYCVDVKRPYGR
jgi:hypothetical protein